MSVKLTCPVCDRSQIETNTCPNCETDLSTYRMLAELPVESPIEAKESKRNILLIGVAGLFLLLGVGLGFAGNSVIARQQPQTTPTSTTASNPVPESVSPTVVEKPEEVETSKSKSCGGFNYVVREGDDLPQIASRFYGDNNNLLSLIRDANPQLQGKENQIEIGATLLIPNREANCP